MRKFGKTVLFILLGAALLEGGGRLIRLVELKKHEKISQRSLYRADPLLGYSLKPGFTIRYAENTPVTTNSMGFRDREYSPRKAAGVFRVVCIGDSRIFGLGLKAEDSFPEQLENMLGERFPDKKIEVINAGVPGYTSREGVILIRDVLPPLQPDLVIAAFGHNDRWRSPYRKGEIAALIGNPPPAYRWGLPVLAKRIDDLFDRIPGYFSLKVKLRGWFRRTPLATVSIEEEFQTNVPPRQYEENLGAMADSARSRGTRLVLLHFCENPALFARTEEGARLLKEGKMAAAEAQLRRAAEIPVNFSPAPHYYLGCLYRARGEDEKASTAFRTAEFGSRIYPHPLRMVEEIFRRRGITRRELSEDELGELPPVRDPYRLIREYEEATERVSRKMGIPALVLDRDTMREEMYLDGNHPGREGCRFLAERISRLPGWNTLWSE